MRGTEWSHCELVNTTDPLSRIDRWMRRHIRSLNSSHEIRCMLPSDGAFAAYVAVHVSLNDQVYTLMSNAVSRFAYTATAHAEYLEPPTGPALGGLLVAVRGTNFSHGVPYACRFGDSLDVLPGSFVADRGGVKCLAPSRPSGTVEPIWVSLNGGQQFSLIGRNVTWA